MIRLPQHQLAMDLQKGVAVPDYRRRLPALRTWVHPGHRPVDQLNVTEVPSEEPESDPELILIGQPASGMAGLVSDLATAIGKFTDRSLA